MLHAIIRYKYAQPDQRILLPTKSDDWTVLDDNSNSSVPGCMGVYYIPCVDVVWLESPTFQEKLIKSPTFHNFADPILHNIVVKDIFAWAPVYLKMS